ncbi:MAG TPA: hypothetical protein PLE60_00060 [Candidatus Latescibacteria bacterium]|nr:hypothetical protein [Candidatus Latescibacterota bacterium]
MVVELQKGELRAAVVDNAPHLEKGGHREGYNGLAALTSDAQQANPFVPFYAGMNLELYFDGVVTDRPTLFEPRRAPMELEKIDQATARLYQPPVPYWKVESWTEFTLREPNYIDFRYRAIPHERTFQRNWLGVFWATYVAYPEDPGIWFPTATPEGVRTMRHFSSIHGEESTHRHAADGEEITVSHDHRMYMYGSYSRFRYARPYFWGFVHGMRVLFMFQDNPNIRFAQSPSGGGIRCPAWDFQLVVPDYQVGGQYSLEARMVYSPLGAAVDPEVEHARWVDFRKNQSGVGGEGR